MDGGDRQAPTSTSAPPLRRCGGSAPQPNPPSIRGAFPIAALVAPLRHPHRTHPACHAAPPSHNPSARRLLLSPQHKVRVLFPLLQTPRPDVDEFAPFPFHHEPPSAAEPSLPQPREIPIGRTNKRHTRPQPCRSWLPIPRRGEGEAAAGEATTPSEGPPAPAPGAVPS